MSHCSFLLTSGKKKILSPLIHDHSRISENVIWKEWKGCPIAGIKQSAKSVKICRGEEVTLAAELSIGCSGSTRRSIDRSPAKRCLFLLLSFFVVVNQSRSIISSDLKNLLLGDILLNVHITSNPLLHQVLQGEGGLKTPKTFCTVQFMIYITESLFLCNNISTLPLAKALEEQDGLPLPAPPGREYARWRRSLRIFVHFVSKPRPSLAGWRWASEVHRGQWGGPGPVVGGDRRWGEVTEMRKEWAVSCQGTCCSEDLDRDVICQVSNSFYQNSTLLRKATLQICNSTTVFGTEQKRLSANYFVIVLVVSLCGRWPCQSGLFWKVETKALCAL